MSDEHLKAVEVVNERNTKSLLSMIEDLQEKLDALEESVNQNNAYVVSVQSAIGTLSDQVMGLLVWRATEEQNRGDDD